MWFLYKNSQNFVFPVEIRAPGASKCRRGAYSYAAYGGVVVYSLPVKCELFLSILEKGARRRAMEISREIANGNIRSLPQQRACSPAPGHGSGPGRRRVYH